MDDLARAYHGWAALNASYFHQLALPAGFSEIQSDASSIPLQKILPTLLICNGQCPFDSPDDGVVCSIP